jgi:hypothetical protein
MCVCVRECVRVCVCVCVCVFLTTCVHMLCVHACVCVFLLIYTYRYMYVCISMCVYFYQVLSVKDAHDELLWIHPRLAVHDRNAVHT